MTLPSPKKRPITVPTSDRRNRISRSLTQRTIQPQTSQPQTSQPQFSWLHFDWHSLGLRWQRSLRTGVVVLTALTGFAANANAQQAASTTPPGWNLQWRKSPKLAEATRHSATSHHSAFGDVFSSPAKTETAASTERAVSRPVDAVTNATRAQVAATQATSQQIGYQSHVYQQPVPNPMRPATHGQGFARNVHQVAPASHVQPASHFQPAGNVPARRVQHAQYVEPSDAVGNYREAVTPTPSRRGRIAQANEFFNNPFADGTEMPASRPAAPQGRTLPQPVTVLQAPSQVEIPQGQMEIPQSLGNGPSLQLPGNEIATPQNDLRSGLPSSAELGLPPDAEPTAPSGGIDLPAKPEQSPAESVAPGSPSEPADQSMRDLLADPSKQIQDPGTPNPTTPPSVKNDTRMPDEATESPSDRDADTNGTFPNPFNRDRSATEGRTGASGEYAPSSSMIEASQLSCEEFRERIARETIDRISLDPSPPFRPHVADPEKYQKQREQFEQRQEVRSWTAADGTEIARGRFIDLAYEEVIIETEDGTRRGLSVKQLGEGDLGFLSENWGLPKECLIAQAKFAPRTWTPQTMTWKASNLCSKTRYFEEVNLERYGHTAGPWLQPAVSSAHFFANIAFLPYKMGVHGPTECHYTLGYYRPGNCAPWIVPPVPISLKGAIAQGAVLGGGIAIIP